MLVNLQDKIYKIRKSKLAPETWQKLCDWRADLAERFLVLWASTRKDARWTAAGFLELGVISSARTGRTLYTPGEYKRAIVVETRNATGQGIRTPRQVMIGISIAQRKGLTKRLTLQQRKTLKRSGALKRQVPAARSQRIAATSQSSAAQSQTVTHALSSRGSDYEFFEQFNYFSDARLFDTHTYIHIHTCIPTYTHTHVHAQEARRKADALEPGAGCDRRVFLKMDDCSDRFPCSRRVVLGSSDGRLARPPHSLLHIFSVKS
jgi:hypothetical protein